MRIVGYKRVSTQEQGQSRNGLEGQEAAIRAFAGAIEAEVVGCYVEVASGKLGLSQRPVLVSALDDARRQGAILVVSKLDRLSRSVEFVSTMMNTRVRFATVEDGLDCDPMMLHLKATFAERERAMIRERTIAGMQAAKARGVIMGWQSHKNPDVSRSIAHCRSARTSMRAADAFAATVAPTIRDLQAAGNTLQQVADKLNAMGTPTARGGLWYASSVCSLLKRLD